MENISTTYLKLNYRSTKSLYSSVGSLSRKDIKAILKFQNTVKCKYVYINIFLGSLIAQLLLSNTRSGFQDCIWEKIGKGVFHKYAHE